MIEYELENDCVGCERCVNCGRREDYYSIWLTCDECGKNDDYEELTLFEANNDRQLCAECRTREVVLNMSQEEILEVLDDLGLMDEFVFKFCENEERVLADV